MTETIKPLYTIFKYGDSGVYKIVKFKRHDGEKIRIEVDEEKEPKSNDEKLANNIARAKSQIIQLALCNPWDYFVTFTLDKEKYDRYDLKKFKEDLSQWFRDKRKKYGTKMSFLYIPERHKDGAWHAHGLMYDVHDDMLASFIRGVHPYKLIQKGYKRMPEYEKKFGFISLGKIKSNIATAFYITKYITKTMADSALDLGVHTYYASKGLNKADLQCDVYYTVPEFEKLNWTDAEFCSITTVQNKPWYYGCDYGEFENYDELVRLYPEDKIDENDEKLEFEKKSLEYEEVYTDGLFDLLRDMHFYDNNTGECVGMA